MPLVDWQFLVVTTVAAGALWVLIRRFAPTRVRARGGKGDPACAHCASNEPARRGKASTRATSTQAAAPAPRTTTTPVVSLRDLRETARKG